MTLTDIPKEVIELFEFGYVPPGFRPEVGPTTEEQRAYMVWKNSGGTIKARLSPEPAPPVWAIVELLGHVKIAGRLTEEEKFGGKIGRVDIPEGEGFQTQYFSHSSVYRISIVTEEVARHVRRSIAPGPVSPWDFPRQQTPALAAPEQQGDEDRYDDLCPECGEDDEDCSCCPEPPC